MLGCNNPGVGVGAENIWGELGEMPFHFRPEKKLEPLPACSRLHQCGEAVSTHPILLAQPRRLSSLPPGPLTISKEVGGWAEGSWGQVPGQLLQLA